MIFVETCANLKEDIKNYVLIWLSLRLVGEVIIFKKIYMLFLLLLFISWFGMLYDCFWFKLTISQNF